MGNIYILIENCCRHFEGVFSNLQDIADYLGIKENKEWTLEELSEHDWLGGYSIRRYEVAELVKGEGV